MTNDVEPAKKVLLPYLQRADELQKHEPLVAYYCRLYGMERGLKIPAKERTKTTNAILISLMNQLEKDKKSIQLSPEDNLYVEGFALSVFSKADKQDRAGRADLSTAKTFYAASIFIEILHQFGPMQPDIEQKQKYAVWKAADIRKALSEGRKPVPGAPGGDDDELSFSPRGSLDSSASLPRSTAAGGGELEGQSHVGHATNAGLEMGRSSLDDESRMGSQAEHQNYFSNAADHGMQQQPPYELPRSGYSSSYPGSYHASGPASPSVSAASPHESSFHMDSYSSQLHPAHHQEEYTQNVPSGGHMYSSLPPTAYVGNNGGPEAPYYRSSSRGEHSPSTVAYPASVPFSADYNSFASSSEPSGLGRTASAPVPAMKVQTFQPTPEKVAEAQKAARFAVSALAFDDVPTAVAYLKQSLELLTGSPN